ncbi:putative aspartic peptidase domain superfamily [Arabidopsis thaliana]
MEGVDESIWRLQTRINQLEDNDAKEDVALEDLIRRQGEVEENQVKNVDDQSKIRASLTKVTIESSRKNVESLDRILDLDKKVDNLTTRIEGHEPMESEEEDSSPHVLCDVVTTYREPHDLEEGEIDERNEDPPGRTSVYNRLSLLEDWWHPRMISLRRLGDFNQVVSKLPRGIPFSKVCSVYHIDRFFLESCETRREMKELYEEALHHLKPFNTLRKIESPGRFFVTCSIQGVKFKDVLCDSGSSINIMTKETSKKLRIKELQPSDVRIGLVDSSFTVSEGIVRIVYVLEKKARPRQTLAGAPPICTITWPESAWQCQPLTGVFRAGAFQCAPTTSRSPPDCATRSPDLPYLAALATPCPPVRPNANSTGQDSVNYGQHVFVSRKMGMEINIMEFNHTKSCKAAVKQGERSSGSQGTGNLEHYARTVPQKLNLAEISVGSDICAKTSERKEQHSFPPQRQKKEAKEEIATSGLRVYSPLKPIQRCQEGFKNFEAKSIKRRSFQCFGSLASGQGLPNLGMRISRCHLKAKRVKINVEV